MCYPASNFQSLRSRTVSKAAYPVLLSCLAPALLGASGNGPRQPAVGNAAFTHLSQVPRFFVENRGQIPAPEVIAFEQGSYRLTLVEPGGLRLVFLGKELRAKTAEAPLPQALELARELSAAQAAWSESVVLRWVGSQPKTNPRLEQPLDIPIYSFGAHGTSHSSRAFERVRYAAVCPGVDVVVYGNQRHLEYDWILAPGADPSLAEVEIEGAKEVQITPEGELEVVLPSGRSFRHHRPFLYQLSGAQREIVPGDFELRRGGAHPRFGFRVGSYDVSRPLIIDPILDFSSYVGGSQYESSNDVALDLLGNAYLTGLTLSPNFPVQSPFQSQYAGGGPDVFVVKIRGDGSGIAYATYIGGSGLDIGLSIEVNRFGQAVVAGMTTSSDFPVVGGFQTQPGGGLDAFVLQLSADGDELLWSSYLGGENVDLALGVAFEPLGGVTVVGQTNSANFPVVEPLQSSLVGGYDAFFARIAPGGSTLVFSSYWGGSGNDDARAVTWSKAGAIVIVGATDSPNLPMVQAFQTQLGGEQDAYVLRFQPLSGTVLSSSYLGGSGTDLPYGVGVDDIESIVVAGATNSVNFPTYEALQPDNRGGWDAFLTRFQPTAQTLIYSTYLGGTAFDAAYGVGLDHFGNTYLAGYTSSNDLPLSSPIQGEFGGGTDAFLFRVSAGGNQLDFGTYLGGTAQDYGKAIAVCSCGLVFVAGETDSPDLPTQNPIYGSPAGEQDGFVSRFMDPDAIFCDYFEIGATTRWGATVASM